MLIQHKNVGKLKELRSMLSAVILSMVMALAACGGGGGGDGDVTEPPPEPPIEPAPDIVCGEIITENITLQADLVCLGDAPFAIEFGASFITLDLGGHSIVGQPPVGSNYARGVTATDKEGITIRNGMINGFDEQVFLSRSHNAIASNMTFKDPRVGAMNILHSQELVVEDSLFDLPVTDLPDVEVGGIGTWGGFTRIRNIEVINGAVGVSFGFPQVCDTAQSPSNGEVLNSRFAGAHISSIYVTCSTDVRIAGNDVATNPQHGIAIVGEGPFFGAVTGLLVEDNVVHDSSLGIQFRGVTDSTATRNQVNDSLGWGIATTKSLGCDGPLPGWECFYSTANLISDNVALGNSPDLYHDAGSTGNTWVNNTCVTKIGIDIPDC